MKVAYIREDNPLVLQDLIEIVSSFDASIDIVPIPKFPDPAEIGEALKSATVLILNASRATFDAITQLTAFEKAGGKIVCIGTLGPGEPPPDSWVLVDAPFTTGSIHSALRMLEAAANGPVPPSDV